MNIKIGENARSMSKLSRLALMSKTNRKSHKWRNELTQIKRVDSLQVQFQKYLDLPWRREMPCCQEY